MHSIQTLFDWIFPPSPETQCVRSLDVGQVLKIYIPSKIDDILALTSFQNPTSRALIHETKFHNNRKAQQLLHVLFAKYLDAHKDAFDIIIPVPLSSRRMRERGHNQVASILKSGVLTIPVETNVLMRQRHTAPQTDLKKDARLKNVEGVFAVKNAEYIAGKRILLVDDVVTTGATLNAAKASLLPYSPSSITLLALAH